MAEPTDERSDDQLIQDLQEGLKRTAKTPSKDDSGVDLEPLADKPTEGPPPEGADTPADSRPLS